MKVICTVCNKEFIILSITYYSTGRTGITIALDPHEDCEDE